MRQQRWQGEGHREAHYHDSRSPYEATGTIWRMRTLLTDQDIAKMRMLSKSQRSMRRILTVTTFTIIAVFLNTQHAQAADAENDNGAVPQWTTMKSISLI